jgi:hypothetical protein
VISLFAAGASVMILAFLFAFLPLADGRAALIVVLTEASDVDTAKLVELHLLLPLLGDDRTREARGCQAKRRRQPAEHESTREPVKLEIIHDHPPGLLA